MSNMFVVYTQIHTDNGIERWYWGCFKGSDKANEVALELGGEYPIYHCVCRKEDAVAYGISNLPRYFFQ